MIFQDLDKFLAVLGKNLQGLGMIFQDLDKFLQYPGKL